MFDTMKAHAIAEALRVRGQSPLMVLSFFGKQRLDGDEDPHRRAVRATRFAELERG